MIMRLRRERLKRDSQLVKSNFWIRSNLWPGFWVFICISIFACISIIVSGIWYYIQDKFAGMCYVAKHAEKYSRIQHYHIVQRVINTVIRTGHIHNFQKEGRYIMYPNHHGSLQI